MKLLTDRQTLGKHNLLGGGNSTNSQ